MEDSEATIAFQFNANALRLLYEAVEEHHKNWSGGDPEEQQALRHMSLTLFAAWLDLTV